MKENDSYIQDSFSDAYLFKKGGLSRQGGISRKIINVHNKSVKSYLSQKKAGNSENGAVFSRKVGSV
jgi:hypothetical protein